MRHGASQVVLIVAAVVLTSVAMQTTRTAFGEAAMYGLGLVLVAVSAWQLWRDSSRNDRRTVDEHFGMWAEIERNGRQNQYSKTRPPRPRPERGPLRFPDTHVHFLDDRVYEAKYVDDEGRWLDDGGPAHE